MKHWKRWIALFLAVALLATIGITALAEEVPEEENVITEELLPEEALPEEALPEETFSYYENYVALGDSCGSGVGLPAYLELVKERGQKWIACEKIEGSYPVKVAEAVGAVNFDQFHFPGARTADIRYLLDPNFSADWVLTGQAAYLSDGVVSKENLDAYREEVIAAIQNADLITLDVGINDVWLPVIAAIYDISGQGRVFNRNMTVPELVMKYGSLGAVVSNASSFVTAWLFHPFRWPSYFMKLTSALTKWVLDYQVNISALMNRIYQLNPSATVVVPGMYNPIEGWDLFPFVNDNLLQRVLQPYYNLLNLRKMSVTALYRGDARYVEMRDVELISDSFTIPLFEFTTVNDKFGYNPHPTERGAETQTQHILHALGIS